MKTRVCCVFIIILSFPLAAWIPYVTRDVELADYARSGMIRWEGDYGSDGGIEFLCLSTYDSSGQMAKWEVDVDNDGEVDQVLEFTYDSAGRLETEERTMNDNDAVILLSYQYDSSGILSKLDTTYPGSEMKGKSDYFYYDDEGRFIRQESDYDMDIGINAVKTVLYDASGRAQRCESDNDNNGTIDLIHLFSYDASDRLVRIDFDYQADGTINEIYLCSYDAEGRLESLEYDFENDSVIDEIEYFYYREKDGGDGGDDGGGDTDGTADDNEDKDNSSVVPVAEDGGGDGGTCFISTSSRTEFPISLLLFAIIAVFCIPAYRRALSPSAPGTGFGPSPLRPESVLFRAAAVPGAREGDDLHTS